MRLPVAAVALGATLLCSDPVLAQQSVIAAIQVQGNTISSDTDIIRESALSQGSPFSDDLLKPATERLLATRRFDRVEVLKRYASISDPTQIVVVIRVDEGPAKIVVPSAPGQSPRVMRRSRLNLMWLPVLDAEDGYGLTYGVQFALTSRANSSGRVIFPLTWGGDKRAGGEYQKEFSDPVVPRLSAGGFVERRTHPYFHVDADVRRIWGRAEWNGSTISRKLIWLHAGTTAAWQHTKLLDELDTIHSIGADVAFDTRLNALLPRNAIFARAAVTMSGGLKPMSTSGGRGPSFRQTQLELDGFIGLYHGTVLALRVLREDANRSVPGYFKSILGGASNLRGFRAGADVADTLAAGSAELRVPLTSPLHVANVGTSVFVDLGTTIDKGQRLRDQDLKRGVGAGLWATAALFRISLMVAHGIGSGTRVHFAAGLTL